jgi:hypothetical protein
MELTKKLNFLIILIHREENQYAYEIINISFHI